MIVEHDTYNNNNNNNNQKKKKKEYMLKFRKIKLIFKISKYKRFFGCPCVGAASPLFFFFGFTPNQVKLVHIDWPKPTDSCRIGQLSPIMADSGPWGFISLFTTSKLS